MYLRHLVPPASLPAFPTPSPANDSARLSKSVTALVYTLDAKLPASYSLTNAFSRNTRIQSTITPTTSTYYSGFVQSRTDTGAPNVHPMLEYRVRWARYGAADDMWLAASDLKSCARIFDDFYLPYRYRATPTTY